MSPLWQCGRPVGRVTVFAALAALGLAACTCTCRNKRPDQGADGGGFSKVDMHTHFGPEGTEHMLRLMQAQGIGVAVNLSGRWPGEGLEELLLRVRPHSGRFVVFAEPPFHRALLGGEWTHALAAELEVAHSLGARGLKISKALGLAVPSPDGGLLSVDDPSLDPLFDKAGELGMPVAIHTGDPVAFWRPVDQQNERWAELSVHPNWSYANRAVPSWEDLFQSFERRVARHPKTTFIGVHFGNAPEYPKRVAALLDRRPNLLVDTAARIPELGRGNLSELRALFLRHQDRILFGTDLGVGPEESQLMLGSRGRDPPTPADVELFFSATWRFFETADRNFPHPTPIQGSWTIGGLGLPPEVLDKLYTRNAERVLGLRHQAGVE